MVKSQILKKEILEKKSYTWWKWLWLVKAYLYSQRETKSLDIWLTTTVKIFRKDTPEFWNFWNSNFANWIQSPIEILITWSHDYISVLVAILEYWRKNDWEKRILKSFYFFLSFWHNLIGAITNPHSTNNYGLRNTDYNSNGLSNTGNDSTKQFIGGTP